MQAKTIFTQVKRELWEHKSSFVISPLLVSGLILVLLLAVAIFSGKSTVNQEGVAANTQELIEMEHSYSRGLSINNKTVSLNNIDFSLIAKEHPDFFGAPTLGVIYANTILLSLMYFVVMLIYAHDCLFDDRKNRTILFWRSMPVSETSNVLVKLGVALFLAPIVIAVLNLILALASVLISIIFFSVHGAPLSNILSALLNVGIFEKIIIFLTQGLLIQLLLAPVFSFILLCSALAKKSPVLISSFIPLTLMFIDRVSQAVLHTNLKIMDSLHAYWFFLKHFYVSYQFSDKLFYGVDLFSGLGLAVVVGAVLISATIWLRNNRYEL